MDLKADEEGMVYALLCKARVDAVEESNSRFEAEDWQGAEYWHERAVALIGLLDREWPEAGPHGRLCVEGARRCN